jgi:hypothetical protein
MARGSRAPLRLISSPASAAVVLLLLSAAVTWPMAVSGGARDHADTLYNSWLLAWNHHALTGVEDPLTPPVFLGQPDAAGRGDLLLTQSLAGGPLLAAGATPLRVHNILFVVSIAFAGWAVMRLASRLGADRWGALFAGCACVCLPYFQSHLWHLQLASVGLGVLALERAVAFLDGKSSGWWVPALILLQGAAGLYHWLFTDLALALTVVWALFRRRRLGGLKLAGLAVLGNAALAPLLVHHLRNAASWPVDHIASTDVLAFVSPWHSSILLGAARPETVAGEAALWPGSAVLAGAAAALAASQVRRRVRAVWLLAAMALVFGAFSLGPTLVAGGSGLAPGPFRLAALLPGVSSIRLPARAGFFALLPLLVLSGVALSRRPALAGLGALLCLVEVLPRPQAMYPTRRCREHRWLAANPREAVVFLPMEPSMERPEKECLRLYGSTLHFTPMVNGYSTSLPSGYRATAGILNGWPSAEADSVLDRIGVDCIVYEDGSEIDADTAIDADTVFSDGRIYVSVISRRPGP